MSGVYAPRRRYELTAFAAGAAFTKANHHLHCSAQTIRFDHSASTVARCGEDAKAMYVGSNHTVHPNHATRIAPYVDAIARCRQRLLRSRFQALRVSAAHSTWIPLAKPRVASDAGDPRCSAMHASVKPWWSQTSPLVRLSQRSATKYAAETAISGPSDAHPHSTARPHAATSAAWTSDVAFGQGSCRSNPYHPAAANRAAIVVFELHASYL